MLNIMAAYEVPTIARHTYRALSAGTRRGCDDDEEEEEEHPALANFVPLVHRMTARISIRDEPSISLPPREEVKRHLALTTPPPSPLTPLLSPLPQIPSPTPNSPTHIKIPESCLPLWKRVRFASPTPSHEVGESSAVGAARQDRPTISRDDPYSIAREDLYGFVYMVDIPPRCSSFRELELCITYNMGMIWTTDIDGQDLEAACRRSTSQPDAPGRGLQMIKEGVMVALAAVDAKNEMAYVAITSGNGSARRPCWTTKEKSDDTARKKQNQESAPNKDKNTGRACWPKSPKFNTGAKIRGLVLNVGLKVISWKGFAQIEETTTTKISRVQFLGPRDWTVEVITVTCKIEIYQDWAVFLKHQRRFANLGLLPGYYRRFIEGFSNIAKTMTKLTQKGVKFDWGDKQEVAFQLLKQKLCSLPIMALPEGSEDFIAYCDASKKGLGALLLQREISVRSQDLEALSEGTEKPDEEEVALDAIPLAVKSPSIIDWKIHKERKKNYYQIIRADGSSKMYLVFSHMLKSFDREDLETLY
ncbi:putative reverse transcriptase domain-containing protein [Tanacetum coccineum]